MPLMFNFLKRLWPRRIRYQLIVGVALVQLVLMALFVFAVEVRQRDFLKSESLADTRAQVVTLAVNSVSWVLAGDVVGLEEIVQSQKQYPGLRYAMVLSRDGKVLAHTDNARVGQYLADKSSRSLLNAPPKTQVIHESPQLIDIAAPILTSNGELIGWARIGQGQERIMQSLLNVTRNGILFATLAILAGSLLAVLIGNRLTSGLGELLTLFSQIRDGRRDLRMQISGADEISHLGEGLNQMLEAIKASESRARILVEKAPDAIIVTDVDLNRFVDANPNAERLFGCSREELLKSSPGRFYTHEQPQGRPPEETIRENTEKVLRGEEVVCERYIRNAEGKDLVCEVHLVRLPPEDRKLIRCSFVDITERRRTEEELRESQERLEFAVESGELGTWDWYPQTGVVRYGDLWAKMLEYEPGEIEPNLTFFVKHLHPEDKAATFEQLMGHIEGRLPAYKSEHRLRTKSGKWRWVMDRGRVVERDNEGHAVRATGIVADITERKWAEEALEKRLVALTTPMESTGGLKFEELFNVEEIQKIQDAFAEATGVASIITDTKGLPITRPSNFCRLCKTIRGTEKGRLNCYRSDAALGLMNPGGPIIQPCLSGGLYDGGASIQAGDQHIANWLIGQVRDESINDETIMEYAKEIGADEEEFRQALQEVPRMPRERFKKIGEALFLIAGQLSRLALQNVQQARTLTERRRVEIALRDSEERFKKLVEQSPLSIQILDPMGKTLLVNKAFEDMWGISGDDLADYNILNDEQLKRKGIMPDIKKGFSGEAASIPAVEFDAKDTLGKGKKRWVQASIYPVKDEQGNVHNVILTHEDISERRHSEEALKQAKEAAEAANRAKDQFIAILSHELRTPLTPVLATISALETQSHLPTELRADMEVIQRNVELEAKLIDDLLDVTRISQGKLELRRETIDAHACFQFALEICRSDIDFKNLVVSLDLTAERHFVWGDMARLQQVFWNLVKNAVKFSPESGRLSIRSWNEGERLKIEVADTGIGIEPELMPRIFNAFEQGEQSKVRRFGGLGLGLSIAKAVVELHHGELTCRSEGKDKGAVFTVALDTVDAPEFLREPTPASTPAIAAKRWKVLIVEDHPDTLRILSRLLQKWGYAVATADGVGAALEWTEKERFDVLVSDLGLPDGSGLDIMRRLKERYEMPGIALSGYGTENDIRQSLDAGFEEHLIKPVGFEALRMALQRITARLG